MRLSTYATSAVAGVVAVAVIATATIATSNGMGEELSATEGSETGLPALEATQEPSVPAETAPAPVEKRKRQPKKLQRYFDIKTRDKVFFITIDDGVYKNPEALKFIRRHRIPVTVFLTNSAINGQDAYFQEMASFGGTIENHTMTHPELPNISMNRLHGEVCGPQELYERKYGHQPTMLRPPYGEGGYSSPASESRKRIDRVAVTCGLRNMVMWNALAENGRFEFLNGKLTRGDIVLFHFTRSLDRELKQVVAMGKRKGLHPAPLQDYVR